MINKRHNKVIDVIFTDEVFGGLRGRLDVENDILIIKLESLEKALPARYWNTSIGSDQLKELYNMAVNGFICANANEFDWVQIPDDYLGGNKQ